MRCLNEPIPKALASLAGQALARMAINVLFGDKVKFTGLECSPIIKQVSALDLMCRGGCLKMKT